MTGTKLSRILLSLLAVVALMVMSATAVQATTTSIDVSEDTEITDWPNWSTSARGTLPESGCCAFGGNLRVSIDNFPNGAWNPPGSGYDSEVLMRWNDLSSIPAGNTITGVILRMELQDGFADAIDVNNITQGTWDEATTHWTNWNAQTTSDTPLGQLDPPDGAGPKDFSSASLLSTVQGWHSGSLSNLGLILKWAGPTTDGDSYASREHTTLAAPQLIITHIPEPGTALLLLGGLGSLLISRRRN